MRRLWVLVNQLPPGSALHRSLAPDTWHWSTTEELLAMTVEAIDRGNFMFEVSHTEPKHKAAPPVRVPRPYDRRKRGPSSLAEQRAFFAGGGQVVMA